MGVPALGVVFRNKLVNRNNATTIVVHRNADPGWEGRYVEANERGRLLPIDILEKSGKIVCVLDKQTSSRDL